MRSHLLCFVQLVVFAAYVRSQCVCDPEGNWAIGFLKGPSPFELQPYTAVGQLPAGSEHYATLNCSSVTNHPTNFLADPFLWIGKHSMHVFYEYKSAISHRGEIGVASSSDGGLTWQHLGTALAEPWHLSYPFVFLYQGEIYMLPEGYQSGGLRVYRAVKFPLQWEFYKELYPRPLVDATIIKHEGLFWMFAADQDKNPNICGQLELYHAPSPLGPWAPHTLNPIIDSHAASGARPGGRPLLYKGSMYRFAQNCGGVYGKALEAYRVDVLNTTHYAQSKVQLSLPKGWWNKARQHHLDAHQLLDGTWVAMTDGDVDHDCHGRWNQETCECRKGSA